MTTPRVLEERCEWLADDVADESIWTEHFSDAEQRELDAALRHALAVSGDVLDIEQAHFPLPTLGVRLKRIEKELIDGRGFVRLRGIDRVRRSGGPGDGQFPRGAGAQYTRAHHLEHRGQRLRHVPVGTGARHDPGCPARERR